MATVSLSQIFDANIEELMNILDEDLFPNKTVDQLNQQLPQVYNEYRKQLIMKYLNNNRQNLYPQLEEDSRQIAENIHFFPSMISNNYTLDLVLNDMNNRSSRSKKSPTKSVTFKHDPNEYYDSTTTLTEQEQKYCRAVLHVAAKQDQWCLEGKNWFGKNPETGKTCTNPYAIASKTVPRTTRPDCLLDLKLDNIPEEELEAEASLHKMTIAQLIEKQNTMRANRGLHVHKIPQGRLGS